MAQQDGFQPRLQYVDRPEISETFADSVVKFIFEGANNTVRIEFCATRMDDPAGSDPASGKLYTTSRLVLGMAAAIDLANKMTNLLAWLEKQGLVTRNPLASFTPPPGKPN
jgi:hypothetical protein